MNPRFFAVDYHLPGESFYPPEPLRRAFGAVLQVSYRRFQIFLYLHHVGSRHPDQYYTAWDGFLAGITLDARTSA